MKFNKKILVGFSLILLFILPYTTQLISAETSEIGVHDGVDAITITTDFITLKIKEGKPHFIWWNGNQSSSDEMYNVQFVSIQDFSGDDETLDSQTELTGISYNLITSPWTHEIVVEEAAVHVTLTLSGLANDVELQFVIHAYAEDIPLEGTDQTIQALTEVKFDIIIKNWQFQENSQGIAIKSYILESQKRHRVRVRSGTDAENGNRTQTMQFVSEHYKNRKVAYYEWANFAYVYDEEELIDTIDVGISNLDDGDSTGLGPGVDDGGMIRLWLTYPNYGDSLKLVHDPSFGINPNAFKLSLYFIPIIGGLIASVVVVGIVRKKQL